MDFGTIISTSFFILLFFAAITSSISLIEPAITFAIEKFSISRTQATTLLGILTWILGLFTVLSFNELSDFKIFVVLNLKWEFDYINRNLLDPNLLSNSIEHYKKFYGQIVIPFIEKLGIKEIINLGDTFDKRRSINYMSLDEAKSMWFDPITELGLSLIHI